jgi:hypothetical protein
MPLPLESLETVASALEGIPTRTVFAGAGILPLLVQPSLILELRGTEDADVIVQIMHYGEWLRLRDMLLDRGFREREDARHNRQILFWLGKIPVDFIPPRMREFGTENRWLDLGYELAEEAALPSGRVVLRLPATPFLASKILAFHARGRRDVVISKDLDDIAALLIGRPELAREMSVAHPEIRAWVAESFSMWRRDEIVWDALPGFVRGQAFASILLAAFESVERAAAGG